VLKVFGMNCGFEFTNKMKNIYVLAVYQNYWNSSKYSPTLNFRTSLFTVCDHFIISQLTTGGASASSFLLLPDAHSPCL
jgi:hypothetical protein